MKDQIPIRIKSILVDELVLVVSPEQIDDNERLLSSMINLDSLGLLKIITALEKEFNIRIEDEELMEANLVTVANLINFVQSKVNSN